ncbi:MAG TPA: phosphotransferase [Aliidongia sp.]|nr:phosphotransferase [Aliidongia sp.]
MTNGAGEAVLVPVLPNHRFDEQALAAYLRVHLPGFEGPLAIRQFQGGQSNPTYHLQTRDRAYVLRKKPPGTLLASAHAVDREFRVLRALSKTEVPVPTPHLLCTDESVIGQMFYVMDHVPGRVLADPMLAGIPPADRSAIYDSMNEVFAKLHQVDYRAVGLEDFGRPDGYAARQIARWSKQYVASDVPDCPAMNRILEWLPANDPHDDIAAIVHGDYRLGNLIVHPTEPRVVAVLDWELATIGHPIADLAYNCMNYHSTQGSGRGFADADLPSLGIPTEEEYLASYCRRTGRESVPHWYFYLAFAHFRIAAILAGVYRRGLDGNASDRQAVERGAAYTMMAEAAWSIAQRARAGSK